MSNTTHPNWWVIFTEPDPATQDIVAVEPEPAPEDVEGRRDQLVAANQRAYVVDAPDETTATDIAMEMWRMELVTTPERLRAAQEHHRRSRPDTV
ncbi:hypothetical protein [Streptomyces murinus]|uniref:hypothetical protein n=1 Tax=Streptomyces murinus TaxID=33900 RepID=UPI003F48CEE7